MNWTQSTPKNGVAQSNQYPNANAKMQPFSSCTLPV